MWKASNDDTAIRLYRYTAIGRIIMISTSAVELLKQNGSTALIVVITDGRERLKQSAGEWFLRAGKAGLHPLDHPTPVS
ncbi:Uncharacterised protein [Mycobacteroides abscessus subsp. massiliense]|nr:Uncharacterised protein [Mycobacteroides abscessus subsp. massiliense]SLD72324.1 Uncharacterised protein [Mycobacteroides abscessus subsp. massiliense]